jgi:hypothetical protein
MAMPNGADLVQVRCATTPTGVLNLEITVQDGWYLFAPGSDEGLPLRVTVAATDVPLQVEGVDGKLAGRFVVSLEPPANGQLQLHLQACNGDQCLRPATMPVRVHAG